MSTASQAFKNLMGATAQLANTTTTTIVAVDNVVQYLSSYAQELKDERLMEAAINAADREERVIAQKAVEIVEAGGETDEGRRFGVVELHVAKAVEEGVARAGGGVEGERLRDARAEGRVVEGGATAADDARGGVQEREGVELVERGQQLARGEVAGGAEEDDDAGGGVHLHAEARGRHFGGGGWHGGH